MLWCGLVGSLIVLFLPALRYSEIPAFRDGFHFYFPQAVWLDRASVAGDFFPSWDFTSGLGTSPAAQNTTALYYPLRLVWVLPLASVPQRYALFVLIHLLVAAIGMQYAARSLRLSRNATWLAMIAFPLSCPVFFQHTNLPYLCSAAWIGFSLGAINQCRLTLLHQRLQSREGDKSDQVRFLRDWIGSCTVFAFSAAMMLLAGDPHTALNAFIIASLALLVTLTQICLGVRRSLARTPRQICVIVAPEAPIERG